jgi:hypothetical protein
MKFEIPQRAESQNGGGRYVLFCEEYGWKRRPYRPQRRGQEWKGDVLLVVLCRDSALLRSSDVELAV